jgi:diguanylate cyclase (GGDEF)-like protein
VRFNEAAEKIASMINENADSEDSEEPKLRIARTTLDALTGTYTRKSLEEHIARLKQGKEFVPFATVLVSLENFDDFNALKGHAGGDLALRFVARSLQEEAGENNVVGRYGGDEFMAVIEDTTEFAANELAGKVAASLKEGYNDDSGKRVSLDNKAVKISVAVVTDNRESGLLKYEKTI